VIVLSFTRRGVRKEPARYQTTRGQHQADELVDRAMSAPLNLQKSFGGIDIYLFDQLLKGRIVLGMRVLDAGCGAGRNLVYLLQSGFEVFGVDESSEVLAQTRRLVTELAPHLPLDNFRVEPVEEMSYPDAAFDAVISSAVLHFARDEGQWQSMVREMWRVLKPGGIFFARLASSIGIEDKITMIDGRYHLPDGSERFLVDEAMLLNVSATLGGQFIEPIKTTIVQNMRSMTTWCLRKSGRQSAGGA
jgi:tellurite methyltransferase